MPQVSRRKLNRDIESKIYETFWQSLASLKTNKEIELFLADLLSPVEITMLAKRLAIAVLLKKGYTYETIKDILKVSQETISSVSLSLSLNTGYQTAIIKIAQAEKSRQFIEQIERLILRLGSPSNVTAPEGYIKAKLGHGKKTLV